MKLDLVYTFVDNTDEKWKSKYHRYYPNSDPLRHNFNNEISLSLRSVEKYFGWVNKIYIVTDNQTFALDMLDVSFRQKIQFVDHTEIIQQEFLPCFNSAAIELFIWKIAGLSESFVYLNDDVFFGRHLSDDDFMTDQRLNQYFFVNSCSPYIFGEYGCIYDSSYRVFHNKWPQTSDFYPVNGHMAHILNKSVCDKLWVDFENELLMTAASRIRTDDCWGERRNFSFLTLHAMELYRTNLAEFVSDIGPVYQDLTSEGYQTLFRTRPKMFCINNITDTNLWNRFSDRFLKNDRIFI